MRDRSCAACGRPLAPDELQFCTDMCRAGYISVFGASSVNESFAPDDDDLSDSEDDLDTYSQVEMESRGWSEPSSNAAPIAGWRAQRELQPTVRPGYAYQYRSVQNSIAIVQGFTDYEPVGVFALIVTDGIAKPMLLDPSEIGDLSAPPGAFILEPSGAVMVTLSTRRVDVRVTSYAFSLVHQNVDESMWQVAGRGDIWILRFSALNSGQVPIHAYEVLQELMLQDEDGCRYPALVGRAAEIVGSYLNWPRELQRFGYNSPPVVPKVPTTGMLAFLVPSGGGPLKVVAS